MSDLLDLVGKHLDRDSITSVSQTIGASPEQTQAAIGAVLPTLIAGLASNAAKPKGDQNLHHALKQDHDGSILDHLGSLFGGQPEKAPVDERATQGGSILDHILGNRREPVQESVSRNSGLTSGQVMKLMMMLAPMLMGILGKKQKQEELSPGGLSDLLKGERQRVEEATSDSGGSSLVAKMFDQDGDGDFDMMDMMKFGAGRLFGK